MKNTKIPKGLRDLLPEEVKIKRNIEKKAAGLIKSYGYQEVITPTFEFLEVVESGTGSDIREELFLFLDREGSILSLRPEVTVSIARLAATHLSDAVFPQRLFYIANVFRHVQPHLAQYREYWQLGIELLGARGPWADAEVLNIAVQALQRIGLERFKISINHIGIFNSLLQASGLTPADQEDIRNLVQQKDLVELSRVLDSKAMDDSLKEAIASLPVLHGGLEVLQRVPYIEKNRQAAEAARELLQTYEALQAHGVIDKIVVDMGVLRRLDYYTGIVFEGYSPDLGYGLLGGGRYDNLMAEFGCPCPATGFALGLDRLALVLKCKDAEPHCYLVGGKHLEPMVNKCQQLREQGFIAQMDLEGLAREELEQRVTGKENWSLIYLDDEPV